ncbi:uncharacterized protein LOC117784103 [Drosophila innubila]|uniref:uncharacterized protein LOC117784103 n=1 Tax=Drosophila innubila TaxID=198719 RepID=UPI00148D729F|nr:uncharacterized protein LOC117784103 [Drosophila innubila]
MLKSRVLCLKPHRRCLSYFSNAFNNLANQGLPILQNANERKSDAKHLDLDAFVNRDQKQMDFLDKLVKLRKQKESTSVPLLPNLVVKQLMDYNGPQEAIPVLQNPLQYGIFIDQFTGCHLIDLLIHNGSDREAAQVAALLIERNLCNNELVASLAFQSFYAFLKSFQPKVVEKVDQSTEVEKVRVKFLRNYVENENTKTEDQLLGEAMIKLAASTIQADLKDFGQNIALLGYVLSGRIGEAEECLSLHKDTFYKGILELGRKLIDSLSEEKPTEFISLLDQAISECKRSDSFDEKLNARVKLSAESAEPQLMSEYSKSFKEWETGYQRALEEQQKIQNIHERVEQIESTLSALQTMRQSLWYFENKEDIDIQIYKKKVYYPKRWFGKKKKPKTVDAFYVPPTISRGN